LSRRLGEEAAAGAGPAQLVYRISSPVSPDHWLNDPREGGGRILGEACHMFDFANWLLGTPERVLAAALPAPPGVGSPESASVTIQYADGSVATIHYSGVGPASMPKERIELLRGGRSWVLDDFRTLTSFGADATRTESSKSGDKGHVELLRRVLAAARGEQPFEPGLGAAYLAQSIGLAALESISSGHPVDVQQPPVRTS
jgi:predicted dehydrogenase